jgi:peptidoglycan/LPS O-acetylase OafA/YrhL
MVTIATAAIAAMLLCGGAVGVFRSARRRGRLLGLAAVAGAGVMVTVLAAPDATAAVTIGAVSAGTLTGLLAVARLFETAGRRPHGKELDLQQDPLRWG